MEKIYGNLVDIFKERIYPAEITIDTGLIIQIVELDERLENFIVPGFIDAHVHIESSMLTPCQFAAVAVRHGTVGVVSDPHEIANVSGIQGVEFMLENGRSSLIKMFFGAPSCVPATGFDSAGANLGVPEINTLLSRDDIYFLSEVMDFPGVICNNARVIDKVNLAIDFNKPIDGHAPGLTGDDLTTYISKGISTDHECFSIQEAKEKIDKGMKILIREGSAAKNFMTLHELIDTHPDMVMLCTDDSHPDDLLNGHINSLVKRGLELGIDMFKLLKAASVNPVLHYSLPVGLLREGDHADFVIVNDLKSLDVISTYVNGYKVYGSDIKPTIIEPAKELNNFRAGSINHSNIEVPDEGYKIRLIDIINNEIVTGESVDYPKLVDGMIVQDIERDILKLVYYNRYKKANPLIGFIRNFGLKKGAIAQTIAHDSHNIIAIGTTDDDLVSAINELVELKGGIVYANEANIKRLRLEIGGIMTDLPAEDVAKQYMEINELIKLCGSKLESPLMTLSFLALVVIPSLKIGEKGLFDVNSFNFVDLHVKDEKK